MSTATLANDEAIHSREFSRSPSKGSPRRALGVLSPNVRITAPNSPIVVDGKPTTTPHGSPLKVQLTVTPADILSAKDIYGYSPYLNVRKRSFAQIDNADGEEPSVEKPTSIMRLMTPNGGRVRRATSVISDSPSDSESDDEDDENTLVHQHQVLPGSSYAAQMNTASFSSLIDYDPAVASDQSESASSSPPRRIEEESQPLSVGKTLSYGDEIEKLRNSQHAQTLKLRLRLAMYKVMTEQELLPFDALELIPPTIHTSSAIADARQLSQDRTLGRAKSSLGNVPKLLPAPALLPTAYSSRKIEYTYSSPPPTSPDARTSEHLATPDTTRTVQNARAHANSDVSPEKERVESRDELTSSVVKGQAASSLMELMRRG